MASLSIRGVDEELSAVLKQKAKSSKQSLNQLVLDILRQHAGLKKEKHFTREYDDLDNLFGRWSEQEFLKIQGQIDSQRKIDEELWK